MNLKFASLILVVIAASFSARADIPGIKMPPNDGKLRIIAFGAHPDDCAEIFNWGFRNPFRFSFDRETGDMLIGDVGQNTYEEIDFQPAGSAGQNFQWNECEGFHTFPGGSAPCAGPSGSVPGARLRRLRSRSFRHFRLFMMIYP